MCTDRMSVKLLVLGKGFGFGTSNQSISSALWGGHGHKAISLTLSFSPLPFFLEHTHTQRILPTRQQLTQNS